MADRAETARLVFLGRLADRVGASECDVEPGPLEAVLASLDPTLAIDLLDERVRLAMNGALIGERGGVVLTAGDELAFLPPVSGG